MVNFSTNLVEINDRRFIETPFSSKQKNDQEENQQFISGYYI